MSEELKRSSSERKGCLRYLVTCSETLALISFEEPIIPKCNGKKNQKKTEKKPILVNVCAYCANILEYTGCPPLCVKEEYLEQ